MKANDIAVDLDALDGSANRISRIMSDLEQYAAQLGRNLAVAGRDFDSVNFERAQEVIQSVLNKLSSASGRLDKARSFMNEVCEKAEQYLRCKYFG